MTIHYDEKGKYFSDIISKTDVRATIQTLTHRIDGRIYVGPSQRPKDTLNENERFLAVTNATVYDPDGNRVNQTEFMAVNREHIIWVIPHEEEDETEEREYDDAA